jgi:hypothetical protein
LGRVHQTPATDFIVETFVQFMVSSHELPKKEPDLWLNPNQAFCYLFFPELSW